MSSDKKSVLTTTLYQDCVAAGLEIDNWQSDLYVRDTPRARQLFWLHGVVVTLPTLAKLELIDAATGYLNRH